MSIKGLPTSDKTNIKTVDNNDMNSAIKNIKDFGDVIAQFVSVVRELKNIHETNGKTIDNPITKYIVENIENLKNKDYTKVFPKLNVRPNAEINKNIKDYIKSIEQLLGLIDDNNLEYNSNNVIIKELKNILNSSNKNPNKNFNQIKAIADFFEKIKNDTNKSVQLPLKFNDSIDFLKNFNLETYNNTENEDTKRTLTVQYKNLITNLKQYLENNELLLENEVKNYKDITEVLQTSATNVSVAVKEAEKEVEDALNDVGQSSSNNGSDTNTTPNTSKSKQKTKKATETINQTGEKAKEQINNAGEQAKQIEETAKKLQETAKKQTKTFEQQIDDLFKTNKNNSDIEKFHFASQVYSFEKKLNEIVKDKSIEKKLKTELQSINDEFKILVDALRAKQSSAKIISDAVFNGDNSIKSRLMNLRNVNTSIKQQIQPSVSGSGNNGIVPPINNTPSPLPQPNPLPVPQNPTQKLSEIPISNRLQGLIDELFPLLKDNIDKSKIAEVINKTGYTEQEIMDTLKTNLNNEIKLFMNNQELTSDVIGKWKQITTLEDMVHAFEKYINFGNKYKQHNIREIQSSAQSKLSLIDKFQTMISSKSNRNGVDIEAILKSMGLDKTYLDKQNILSQDQRDWLSKNALYNPENNYMDAGQTLKAKLEIVSQTIDDKFKTISNILNAVNMAILDAQEKANKIKSENKAVKNIVDSGKLENDLRSMIIETEYKGIKIDELMKYLPLTFSSNNIDTLNEKISDIYKMNLTNDQMKSVITGLKEGKLPDIVNGKFNPKNNVIFKGYDEIKTALDEALKKYNADISAQIKANIYLKNEEEKANKEILKQEEARTKLEKKQAKEIEARIKKEDNVKNLWLTLLGRQENFLNRQVEIGGKQLSPLEKNARIMGGNLTWYESLSDYFKSQERKTLRVKEGDVLGKSLSDKLNKNITNAKDALEKKDLDSFKDYYKTIKEQTENLKDYLAKQRLEEIEANNGMWASIRKHFEKIPWSKVFSGMLTGLKKIMGGMKQALHGIVGMFSNLYRNLRRIVLTITGTMTAMSASVVGTVGLMGYKYKKYSQEIINTTEKYRQYQIALKGSLKTQEDVNKLMSVGLKVTSDMPIAYDELMESLKSITLISPIANMMTDAEATEKTLKKVYTILSGLHQLQPQWGMSGAVFSLRNALAGDLRSLERRFDLPTRQIQSTRGMGLSNVKHNPQELIESLYGYFQGFMDEGTLREMNKQFSKSMIIMKQTWEQFVTGIGDTGFYDKIADDFVKLRNMFQKWINSGFANKLKQNLGNAFITIYNDIKRLGNYIIDLFGGNKIISKLSDAITFIAKSFRYLVNTITKKELKDGLAKNLGEAFDYIKEQYAKFKNYIGTEDFKNKVETIKNYIVSAIETVKKTVNIAWDTVVNVYDWLVKHFGTEATMQGLIVTYLLGPGNIMSVLSGVTTAFSGLLTMVLNIGTALSKLAFSNSFMLAISSITMAFGIWSDFFMHPDDFMKKVTAFTTVLSSWLDEFLTKLKYGVLDAMGENWSKESVEKTFNKNGFKAEWDKTKSGYENYAENEKKYIEHLKTYEGYDFNRIKPEYLQSLRATTEANATKEIRNEYISNIENQISNIENQISKTTDTINWHERNQMSNIFGDKKDYDTLIAKAEENLESAKNRFKFMDIYGWQEVEKNRDIKRYENELKELKENKKAYEGAKKELPILQKSLLNYQKLLSNSSINEFMKQSEPSIKYNTSEKWKNENDKLQQYDYYVHRVMSGKSDEQIEMMFPMNFGNNKKLSDVFGKTKAGEHREYKNYLEKQQDLENAKKELMTPGDSLTGTLLEGLYTGAIITGFSIDALKNLFGKNKELSKKENDEIQNGIKEQTSTWDSIVNAVKSVKNGANEQKLDTASRPIIDNDYLNQLDKLLRENNSELSNVEKSLEKYRPEMIMFNDLGENLSFADIQKTKTDFMTGNQQIIDVIDRYKQYQEKTATETQKQRFANYQAQFDKMQKMQAIKLNSLINESVYQSIKQSTEKRKGYVGKDMYESYIAGIEKINEKTIKNEAVTNATADVMLEYAELFKTNSTVNEAFEGMKTSMANFGIDMEEFFTDIDGYLIDYKKSSLSNEISENVNAMFSPFKTAFKVIGLENQLDEMEKFVINAVPNELIEKLSKDFALNEQVSNIFEEMKKSYEQNKKFIQENKLFAKRDEDIRNIQSAPFSELIKEWSTYVNNRDKKVREAAIQRYNSLAPDYETDIDNLWEHTRDSAVASFETIFDVIQKGTKETVDSVRNSLENGLTNYFMGDAKGSFRGVWKEIGISLKKNLFGSLSSQIANNVTEAFFGLSGKSNGIQRHFSSLVTKGKLGNLFRFGTYGNHGMSLISEKGMEQVNNGISNGLNFMGDLSGLPISDLDISVPIGKSNFIGDLLGGKSLLQAFTNYSDSVLGTTGIMKGASSLGKSVGSIIRMVGGKKAAGFAANSANFLSSAGGLATLGVVGVLSQKGWLGGAKDRTAEGRARYDEYNAYRNSLVKKRYDSASQYYMSDLSDLILDYQFGGINAWTQKRGKWYKGTKRKVMNTDATDFVESMKDYWDLMLEAAKDQLNKQRALNKLQSINQEEYIKKSYEYAGKQLDMQRNELADWKGLLDNFKGKNATYTYTDSEGFSYTFQDVNDEIEKLTNSIAESEDKFNDLAEQMEEYRKAFAGVYDDYILKAMYGDSDVARNQMSIDQIHREYDRFMSEGGEAGSKEWIEYQIRLIDAQRDLTNAIKQLHSDYTNQMHDVVSSTHVKNMKAENLKTASNYASAIESIKGMTFDEDAYKTINTASGSYFTRSGINNANAAYRNQLQNILNQAGLDISVDDYLQATETGIQLFKESSPISVVGGKDQSLQNALTSKGYGELIGQINQNPRANRLGELYSTPIKTVNTANLTGNVRYLTSSQYNALKNDYIKNQVNEALSEIDYNQYDGTATLRGNQNSVITNWLVNNATDSRGRKLTSRITGDLSSSYVKFDYNSLRSYLQSYYGNQFSVSSNALSYAYIDALGQGTNAAIYSKIKPSQNQKVNSTTLGALLESYGYKGELTDAQYNEALTRVLGNLKGGAYTSTSTDFNQYARETMQIWDNVIVAEKDGLGQLVGLTAEKLEELIEEIQYAISRQNDEYDYAILELETNLNNQLEASFGSLKSNRTTSVLEPLTDYVRGLAALFTYINEDPNLTTKEDKQEFLYKDAKGYLEQIGNYLENYSSGIRNMFDTGLFSMANLEDALFLSDGKNLIESFYEQTQTIKKEIMMSAEKGKQANISNAIKDLQNSFVNSIESWYEYAADIMNKDTMRNAVLSSISGFDDFKIANSAREMFNNTITGLSYGKQNTIESLMGIGNGEFGTDSLSTMLGISSADLQRQDPYELYYEYEKSKILNRIENAEEESDEAMQAYADLWNVMKENAEYLKRKADETTESIEKMLDRIEETARTRVSEEAKTQKGDVIFIDLGSARDMNGTIRSMIDRIKTNDPDAQKLVNELKTKLLNLRK